jgi:hypothetical protein
MKILVAVDGSKYTNRMLAWWAAHEELLSEAHNYTGLCCTTRPPSATRRGDGRLAG